MQDLMISQFFIRNTGMHYWIKSVENEAAIVLQEENNIPFPFHCVKMLLKS